MTRAARAVAALAAALVLLSGCALWDGIEERVDQEDAAKPFYVVPDPQPRARSSGVTRRAARRCSSPPSRLPTTRPSWNR